MPASLIILLLVLAVVASTVTLIVRGITAGKKAVGETIRLRGERHAQGPVEGLKVRPLTDADRASWEKLWDAYCDFYGEVIPPSTTETTWKRLMDPASSVKGFAACSPDGTVIGLAHIVLHPHTWSPKTLCYLEDLYVVPAFRGRDVGHALISFLWQKAETEGWGRVYWHTEATNAAARRLYDRFRPADGYVRYTLTL